MRPTGADRVGWIAVGPVETTLAGTNIGSSGAGPAVGRAGSAGAFTKFRFEGARKASWMTYGRKKKEKGENKNKRGGRLFKKTKKKLWVVIHLKDKRPPHQSQNKSCTCSVLPECRIYTRNVDTYVRSDSK